MCFLFIPIGGIMTRIKIDDLQMNKKISKNDMKMFRGGVYSGSSLYTMKSIPWNCVWDIEPNTNTSGGGDDSGISPNTNSSGGDISPNTNSSCG